MKSFGVLLKSGSGWAWLGEGMSLTLNTVKALRWLTSEEATSAARFVSKGAEFKIGRLNGKP